MPMIRLIPFLLLSLPLFAADLIPAGDVLKLFNDGSAPTVNAGTELDAVKHALRFQLKTLIEDFSDPTLGVEPGCGRYSALLRTVTEQIALGIEDYNLPPILSQQPDETVLKITRLRLLIPGLFELHALFRNQSEAGYGTLDRHIHESCAFVNRDEVTQHFDTAVRALSDFSRNALGNPGLNGFEALTDRLLKISAEQEKNREAISWGVFGATLVTSVVIWESVPVLLSAASRGALSRSPAVLARLARTPSLLKKTFIFGTRSVGLGAEGLVYSYIDKAIAAPKANTPEEMLANWDEQLAEVEQLSNSTLWSPQIYLAYVGRVKAQLALLFQPWLREQMQNGKSQISASAIGTP